MTDNFPTFRRIRNALPTLPGRLFSFLRRMPRRMLSCLWMFTKKTAKVSAVVIVVFVIVHSVLWVIWSRQLNADIDRMRKQGIPTTYSDLLRNPIPDSENAAIIYEKAHKQLKDDRYIEEFIKTAVYNEPITHNEIPPQPGPPPTATPSATNTAPSPAPNPPAVHVEQDTPARREARARRVLAEQAETFRLIDTAVSKPKCRFKLYPPGRFFLWSPHLITLRGLCKLEQAKAIIDARDGRVDDALTGIRQALNIGDSAQNGHNVLSFECRVQCINRTLDTLQVISKREHLSPKQCKAVYDALATPELEKNLHNALIGERIDCRYIFDGAREDPSGCLLMLMDLWEQETGKIIPKIFQYAWRPLSYKEEQAYLGYMDVLIEASNLPYRDFIKKYPDCGEKLVPKYAFITQHLCLISNRPWAAKDIAKAKIGLAQTAMALKAYKNNFRAYPTSMTELRQKLGWKIPNDPFTGKDFVYARKDKGFLLYSLGRDLKDNHGRSLKTMSDRKDYDIVWRAER